MQHWPSGDGPPLLKRYSLSLAPTSCREQGLGSFAPRRRRWPQHATLRCVQQEFDACLQLTHLSQDGLFRDFIRAKIFDHVLHDPGFKIFFQILNQMLAYVDVDCLANSSFSKRHSIRPLGVDFIFGGEHRFPIGSQRKPVSIGRKQVTTRLFTAMKVETCQFKSILAQDWSLDIAYAKANQYEMMEHLRICQVQRARSSAI